MKAFRISAYSSGLGEFVVVARDWDEAGASMRAWLQREGHPPETQLDYAEEVSGGRCRLLFSPAALAALAPEPKPTPPTKPWWRRQLDHLKRV